jgi:hypothetical protein
MIETFVRSFCDNFEPRYSFYLWCLGGVEGMQMNFPKSDIPLTSKNLINGFHTSKHFRARYTLKLPIFCEICDFLDRQDPFIGK